MFVAQSAAESSRAEYPRKTNSVARGFAVVYIPRQCSALASQTLAQASRSSHRPILYAACRASHMSWARVAIVGSPPRPSGRCPYISTNLSIFSLFFPLTVAFTSNYRFQPMALTGLG